MVRKVLCGLGGVVMAFACGGDGDGASPTPLPGAAGEGGGETSGGMSGDVEGGAPSSGGSSAHGGEIASEAGQPSAGSDSVGGQASCVGDECEPTCDEGTTRISGKVFDPSGTLPLYNVSVFVPEGPVEELEAGVTCGRCDQLEVPSVTRTLTAVDGSFVLEGAPAGADIPVVIQVGKWRRQLTIENVEACETTLLEAERTRLPRTRAEGDIPHIAIVAGGQDQLECLPRRLGIADSEFTLPSGDGRINLYAGGANGSGVTQYAATLNGGASLPQATALWGSAESLSRYDLVLLGCEGGAVESQKPLSARQAMYDYASSGGRVLATHWQSIWFTAGPEPLPSIANWSNRLTTGNGEAVSADVNESFTKGQAFAQWLVNVEASETSGSLAIHYPNDNVQSVDAALAREWLSIESAAYPQAPHAVQYLSTTVPVGATAAKTCGRMGFSSTHLGTSNSLTGAQSPFPENCEQREMSAIEKAAVFQLFELSSCIGDDDVP